MAPLGTAGSIATFALLEASGLRRSAVSDLAVIRGIIDWRPVRSVAISVVPEPRKRSSTRLPRRVTSWMASATMAVGLTVGCRARSSFRLPRIELTEA
jgi:hypothetical protein